MYICIQRQHSCKLIFIQIKDWLLKQTYDRITNSNPIFERLYKTQSTYRLLQNISIHLYRKSLCRDLIPTRWDGNTNHLNLPPKIYIHTYFTVQRNPKLHTGLISSHSGIVWYITNTSIELIIVLIWNKCSRCINVYKYVFDLTNHTGLDRWALSNAKLSNIDILFSTSLVLQFLLLVNKTLKLCCQRNSVYTWLIYSIHAWFYCSQSYTRIHLLTTIRSKKFFSYLAIK